MRAGAGLADGRWGATGFRFLAERKVFLQILLVVGMDHVVEMTV